MLCLRTSDWSVDQAVTFPLIFFQFVVIISTDSIIIIIIIKILHYYYYYYYTVGLQILIRRRALSTNLAESDASLVARWQHW